MRVSLPFLLRVRVPVPRVTLTALPGRRVLIRFSEPVSTFQERHIDIAGGTFFNFRGNHQEFLIELSAGNREIYIGVQGAVVRNKMGILNMPSEILRVT